MPPAMSSRLPPPSRYARSRVSCAVVSESGVPATAMTRTPGAIVVSATPRSEEHTSELQSRSDLVCRLLLEKKKDPRHLLRGPSSGPPNHDTQVEIDIN